MNDTPIPPRLQAWLDEQSRVERSELERTWELAALARPEAPAGDTVDEVWSELARDIDRPTPRRRAADRPPAARRSRRVLVAAAVAVVVVALGLVLWLRPLTYEAAYGQMLTVHLPDGSEATLAPGSRLTHDRPLFGWDRDVRLDGEAFFDVVEGPEPFEVQTSNAAVRVLGTRFDVRARADEGTPVTAVAVAEGRVRLVGEDVLAAPVTLGQGQGSRVVGFGGRPVPPTPVDLEAVLAWRRGALAFDRQPLGAVIDELERRFAVAIDVRPQSLRRDTFSLFLPQATSAAAVLEEVCAYRGYRCWLTGDPLVIAAPDR